MAEGLNCPSMKWTTGDDQGALTEYKQRLKRWFVIKGTKPEDQHNFIIYLAGEKGEELSKAWELSDEQLKDPKVVWEKFEQSVGVADNFRVHRLMFNGYRQEEKESVDEFYTRCRALSLKCQFKCIDERIIDQLILGTKNSDARKDLLKGAADLKLEDALKICRTHEAAQVHLVAFEKADGAKSAAQIHLVRREHPQQRGDIRDCRYCGEDHMRGKCPAYKDRCEHCGRKGHWKIKCRETITKQKSDKEHHEKQKKGKSRTKSKAKKVHSVQYEGTSDSDFDSLQFDVVDIGAKKDINVKVEIRMANASGIMKCKVDTGAQGNVMPVKTLKKICPDLVGNDDKPIYCHHIRKKPSVKLDAYNGTEIQHYGCVTVKLRHQDISKEWLDTEFFIVNDGAVILGQDSSIRLGIVSVNVKTVDTLALSSSEKYAHIKDTAALKTMYADRFKGLGNFKGASQIQLKEDATPVVTPPRKYPIHLKSEIAQQLKEMMALEVIEPIPEGESCEWLSSLAFSRKESGKLRICLDPRNLNNALKRTYHRTPTIEEISHRLANARVFSKLDAKHGYWSIRLDEASAKLTSFSAPGGRYRFKRLPFGLKVAQDLFQEKMDAILTGCPGTINIADDILVFGRSEQDHDRNLHKLMQRAKECGLIFNGEKCHIKLPEVDFFGFKCSKEGVRPDDRKVEEIRDLPRPSSVKDLQHALGMVQYLAPFIPRLSEKTSILRDLIKKDAPWRWDPEHEQAYSALKQEICSAVSLNYFDPNLETKVQVDASMKGLGAALIQLDTSGKERVIAFASKALTPTETRYANIEREMLAVVFGAERFHTYLYGCKFLVESDHKPLENIFLKNVAQAPPRLQRMLLRIQPYDMTIKYRPGKELALADAMSRINPRKGAMIKMEQTIHSVRWSDRRMEEIQQATEGDPELVTLKQLVINGWPSRSEDVPKIARPYWSMKDILAVEDGVLMKGQKIIIPSAMKSSILQQLHAGHQGREKTTLRAKTCVY